jgi:hypothetical protein
MEKLCVYATGNSGIHEAIVKLFEKKTGAKRYEHLMPTHKYIYNTSGGVVHGMTYKPDISDRKIITIKELEEMGDWKEETIIIDGRNWSLSTVKEALKNHADY